MSQVSADKPRNAIFAELEIHERDGIRGQLWTIDRKDRRENLCRAFATSEKSLAQLHLS